MTDLIAIFQGEVEANLKEATRLALAFEQRPPERTDTEAMMRVFHTLKGAARAIGFDQERDVAHALEDVFHDVMDGRAAFRPASVDLALAAVDLIRDSLGARLAGSPLPALEPFQRRVADYRAGRSAAHVAPAQGPAAVTAPGPVLDLMAIFSDEVAAQAAEARARLASFDPAQAGESEREDMRRVFHTLKGAARAIGCLPIREVAAALEDLMRGLENGTLAPRADLTRMAECALRWIEALLPPLVTGREPPGIEPFLSAVEAYRAGAPAPECAPPETAAASHARTARDAGGQDPEPERIADTPGANPAIDADPAPAAAPPPRSGTPRHPGEPSPRAQSAAQPRARPQDQAHAQPQAQAQTARLAYEQLDRLHRLSGELTVAVSSLGAQRNGLRGLLRTLARGSAQSNRLVSAAVAEELDGEALQDGLRQLAQGLADAGAALESLTDAQDRMEGRFRTLADALADEVTQARLVPLADLFDDYPRMVRDLGLELGKRMEVRVDGVDNRIDRAVLEHLRNPLLHLVRNAIDHGIESAGERAALGKPAVGRLAVEARRLGTQMRIRVGDDGSGIDLARLERAVVAAGHTTHALWEHMGLEERMQFLFLPGLSTAEQVSKTSGRGIGLDIVKSGIEAAGGTVGVHSEAGRGTCFELRVPLSLSLTRCLLAVGGRHPLFGAQHYAFPMAEVSRVRRPRREELREIEGRMAIHVDGETLPLFQLHAILGLAPTQADLTRKHLLVLGESEGRFGLLVEAVVDELDMVARPLDERLGKVAQVSGLTLLDDGGVALILDVPDLIQHMREGAGHLAALAVSGKTGGPPVRGLAAVDPIIGATAGEPAPEDRPATVLVVEDSVTVREVERHFLEQAGYEVTTAVNGVDGLNKAKAGDHQILITDIDMPRMNGIELIRTLRAMDRFRRLPIVVVSYKDRPEDRDKAIDAGADRYVTKSEFDTDAMLAMVAELLEAAQRRAD